MYVTLGVLYLIDVGDDKKELFSGIPNVIYYNVKPGRLPRVIGQAVVIKPSIDHPKFDVYYETVRRHYIDANILEGNEEMRMDVSDYSETEDKIVITIGSKQFPLIVDRYSGLIHVVVGDNVIPRALMIQQ
jgi:hypothetical protein